MVKLHFPSENKEENPLLLQRQSHFAPQNKEENPLLVRGLAFSFGKQGGLYVRTLQSQGR